MSDELTVTVGATSVVVDELRSAAARLDRLVTEVGSASARVAAVDRLASVGWLSARGAPAEAVRANSELGHARIAIAQVELQARGIAWALTCAADGYDGAERLIGGTISAATDELGWTAGRLFAGMFPTLLAVGFSLGAAFVALFGRDAVNRIASDPWSVAAVRLGVRASDDAILGAAGIPQPVVAAFGEHGLGLTGLPFAAGVLALGVRSAGVMRESPARVASAVPLPIEAAPTGVADRFARVPRPDELDGAQVVVERYEDSDGRASFEVYIAGTVDFNPFAHGEPWDMASNVSNAIGDDGGSVAAVRAALLEAGVRPDDPIQFTGYSQGGAVAAHLVASGDYASTGLVTFGGPTGQIAVPDDVPTLFVEHTDDLVVALGGEQENETAVVVRRWATEGMDFEATADVPAHQRPAYAQTARLIDASGDASLVATRETLASFADDKRMVERTAYHCVRVDGLTSAATSSSRGAGGSR